VAAVTEIRQADDEWWRIVAKDFRRMKTRIVRRLAWLVPAVLSACATNHPSTGAPAGTVTPQMRSGSGELRTYKLIDWIAPDDRTLIMNSVDRALFRVQFKRQCTGMRQVDTIAFIVQMPPQIEKYQAVVLPNGTRCVITSITRLEAAPAK
jgi:hypothetical protein